jgi:hypothetical protein
LFALLTTLLSVLPGCGVHSGVTTAHTVGKGAFQGAIEPGAVIAAGGGASGAAPTLNFAFRYGVSDKVDFGVRLGTTTYELFTKVMLTEPDPSAVVASVAPHATVWALAIGGAGFGFFDLKVPVLIGVPVGESQLVLAPKARVFGALAGGSGASAQATLLMLGGGVGFSGKVGEKFRIHPEVTADIPVAAIAGASAGGTGTAGAAVTTGGVLVGVNLGFLIGGR